MNSNIENEGLRKLKEALKEINKIDKDGMGTLVIFALETMGEISYNMVTKVTRSCF